MEPALNRSKRRQRKDCDPPKQPDGTLLAHSVLYVNLYVSLSPLSPCPLLFLCPCIPVLPATIPSVALCPCCCPTNPAHIFAEGQALSFYVHVGKNGRDLVLSLSSPHAAPCVSACRGPGPSLSCCLGWVVAVWLGPSQGTRRLHCGGTNSPFVISPAELHGCVAISVLEPLHMYKDYCVCASVAKPLLHVQNAKGRLLLIAILVSNRSIRARSSRCK